MEDLVKLIMVLCILREVHSVLCLHSIPSEIHFVNVVTNKVMKLEILQGQAHPFAKY